MRRRLRTAACAALLAPAALAALMLSAGCTKSNADWIVDLDDPEPYARVMAAVALGRSGDPAAVPALLDALGDDSAQVSAAAGDALRALGAPAVLPLLDALRRESGASLTDKERALETLPTLGAPAVAPVVQALREGDRYDGDALVSILGRLGAPAVPALLAVLQSRDEQLASQAARALAIAGPAAAGPGGALDALATALTRPEAALRVEVARAIKAIDPTHPNALAALVRDSHDPDPEARRAVLQGAVAGLLQLLRDGNELQRRAAGLQLQDLGLAAVPALCAALKECAAEDVDGPARCLAALGVPALRETIGAFNQRNPFHVQRLGRVIELVGADALPELLAIIGERENGSRVMAASVVGALGSDAASAFPVLLSLLDEPPSSLIHDRSKTPALLVSNAITTTTKLVHQVANVAAVDAPGRRLGLPCRWRWERWLPAAAPPTSRLTATSTPTPWARSGASIPPPSIRPSTCDRSTSRTSPPPSGRASTASRRATTARSFASTKIFAVDREIDPVPGLWRSRPGPSTARCRGRPCAPPRAIASRSASPTRARILTRCTSTVGTRRRWTARCPSTRCTRRRVPLRVRRRPVRPISITATRSR